MEDVSIGPTWKIRIGVWNLKQSPSLNSLRGRQMHALAQDCSVDIWLFTEVHADWALPGFTLLTSGPRSGAPERHRWSGIACRDTLRATRIFPSVPGPAEEGLCLARISDPSRGRPDLLVACSVLPWANTTVSWPTLHTSGLYGDSVTRFRGVTAEHVQPISWARQDKDIVIWGGDFNQSLAGRVMGSRAGQTALTKALDDLVLSPLTADARHLIDGASSIDHLAVSAHWPGHSTVSVITSEDDARQTSDHALYLIDIEPRDR